jgi:hypothetical protein
MRIESSAGRLLTLATAALTLAVAVQAQSTVPRTPDGHPDLQGFWNNGIITPLQRPAALAAKPFFTPEEAAAFENGSIERFRQNRGEIETITNGEVNELYQDGTRVVGRDRRTSLIVDPPDGRVPALTPAAKARAAARDTREKNEPFDDPESFIASERCLLWGAGPPMIPAPYNNYLEIVQSPHAVVIANEMIHDARVVPLDGRPHLPASLRQWKGDSRGHWEGDALVIETTNFSDRTTVLGSGPGLRVVERLTRVAADELQYEFTVHDPESFTQPWTARWILTRAGGPLYEYACHEGNYSIVNIIKGARAAEREAAAKPVK